MSVDRRRANANWYVADAQGNNYSEMCDGTMLAVLMDVRDELQKLNRLLHCTNFTDIPHVLRAIRRNTTKRKRKVTK